MSDKIVDTNETLINSLEAWESTSYGASEAEFLANPDVVAEMTRLVDRRALSGRYETSIRELKMQQKKMAIFKENFVDAVIDIAGVHARFNPGPEEDAVPELPPHIAECEAQFRELLDTEYLLGVVLRELKARVSEMSLEARMAVKCSVENVEKRVAAAFRAYLSQSARQKYARHHDYVQFRYILWYSMYPETQVDLPDVNRFFSAAQGDADEDDVQVQSMSLPIKCPITSDVLDHPVTSTACYHTYSRDAIESMIPRDRGAVACPIPGCNEHVTKDSLFPDKLAEKRVEVYKRHTEAMERQDAGNYEEI